MSSPIPEIAAKATSAVLDRYRLKSGVARFYLKNASLKNNLPEDCCPDEQEVSITMPISQPDTVEQPPPTPPALPPPEIPKAEQPVTPVTPAPTPTPTATKSDWLKKAAIAAALAGVPLGSYAAWQHFSSPEKPASAVQETEDGQYRESPYQYLEDQGDHLP